MKTVISLYAYRYIPDQKECNGFLKIEKKESSMAIKFSSVFAVSVIGYHYIIEFT